MSISLFTRSKYAQDIDWASEKGRPVKGTKSNLTSVALPNLGFFFTCRQIYHEATTIFYSQNTFAVTRPRCSPWNGGPEHDDGGQLFTDGADWILSLGSRLSKLTSITLDLNALCMMHQGNLELLPLLRALWNRNWTGKLEFKSASVMQIHERRCEERGKAPGIGKNPDLTTINGMIASLVRDDLDIRKHVWALGHVAFHCSRLDGLVLFPLNRKVRCSPGKTHRYDSRYSSLRSDGSCFEHRLNFKYHNGQCVRIPQRSLELMDLAPHIRLQIFDQVLRSSEPILLDLSSVTGNHLPALLSTNIVIRTYGAKQYYRLNRSNLLVKYKIGQDDLITFQKMVQWMFQPAPGLDEDVMSLRRDSIDSLQLDFESVEGGPRRLEDLRINTADLWHKRVSLGAYSSGIKIEVRLWSILKNEEVFEEAIFKLDVLLENVSRALHELYNANMGFRRGSMLEIVVDGYGEPKGYVHPTTEKVHPFPRTLTISHGEKWLQWHKEMKKHQ